MEILITLVLLVVGFLVLNGKIEKTNARVGHVERYLQEATKYFTGGAKEESVHQESVHVETPVQKTENITAPVSSVPKPNFIDWLKNDWLMKLGAFLLILGLVWFVKYAFAEGWIGPMGRIALGLMVGAGMLVLGRFRMNRFVSQGSILLFAGALTVVLTVWAGRELYGFFTQTSALVIMFLTSGVLGVTSVFFKRVSLAYANVSMSALVPLLVSLPESETALFTYLLVLTLGAVWVAALTGWRQLILASLGIVFVYSLQYIHPDYAGCLGCNNSSEYTLLFVFAFSAIFFLTSIVGMRLGRMSIADVMTGALTGLFLLVWILADADSEWQSLLFVAWTIVFAYGAYIATRLGASLSYFYTYAGVGVVFLGTATALELDGPEVVIALLFEALLLLVVGERVTKSLKSVVVLALPSIVPLLLTIESIQDFDVDGEHGVVLYTVTFLIFLTARHFENLGAKYLPFVRFVYSLFGVYATVLVWLISTDIFSQSAGAMVALFVYTLTALIAYVRYVETGVSWHKIVSFIFFALVVLRLLLVEVWMMDLLFRVITFVCIGLLLMFVAWQVKNRKAIITNE